MAFDRYRSASLSKRNREAERAEQKAAKIAARIAARAALRREKGLAEAPAPPRPKRQQALLEHSLIGWNR